MLYAGGVAEEPDREPLLCDLDHLIATMQPWSTGGLVVGFLGPDSTPDQLARGYSPGDLDRLDCIKRSADPDDRFRVHHGRADRPDRTSGGPTR